MSDSTPLVSVIVPTRNNTRTIRDCLASVRAQTYARIELLVVDNTSTDDTVEIAEGLADKVLSGGPERSAQRNLGIEHARGEWVLWVDSDMVLPADGVAAAVRTALHHDAAAVSLPERTIGEGFWTACRALERACYVDQLWLNNPRLVRRELLTGEHAFNLEMTGLEDTDLRMRLREAGKRVEFAPTMIDHDEGRLTLEDVLRKRYYYGRSIPSLADAHDGAVRSQGGALIRAYVSHRSDLLRDPVHTAGMVVLRGLEAGAYVLGARRGRRDQASRRDRPSQRPAQ
ncbi:glycosyltransferase family 2 protein [Leekyejoonella antrihumi]|uniref:Glycosyltransferase n=1 Tax=Leekyejoonella antrihumi TaxID=1660198 RepID=A0A563E3M8_9MICO|nr:glycosyltransferase [Leekyejoonella antrihumi]TWP37128.1 glycosyltransferase [Leekyejoonella antrihumi]